MKQIEKQNLVLIDLENLLGRERFLKERALQPYLQAVHDRLDSLKGKSFHLISTGPELYEKAKGFMENCHGCCRLMKAWGPDGADYELLSEMEPISLKVNQYARLIVCSGDGIFAPGVGHWRKAGGEVGVISRRGSLSYQLRRAANWYNWLDVPPACSN